jgi:hypothetical protein
MPTRDELLQAKRRLRENQHKLDAAIAGLPADGDLVATQAAVAEHFHVRRSTVTGWIAKGMPGEVGRWSLKEIKEWRASQDDEETLLGSSSDSPWLEELRKNKALQEQIKLEGMRRTVVQIDRMRDALSVWSSILKRLGERAGRQYGREAADMVADAIDDCERVLSPIFAEGCGNGDGNTEPASDGGAVASGGSPGSAVEKGAKRRKARASAVNKRVGRKRASPAKRSVSKRAVQTPSAPGKQTVVRGFGQWTLE